jgi:hypothetical protein
VTRGNHRRGLQALPTRDPWTGGELVVTRLESADTGTAIEGRFTLGWLGRLTPDQLEFVALLLRNRNNLHKLAAEAGIAYNTARNRFDEIVAALGGPTPARGDAQRTDVLARLAAKEISVDEAAELIGGGDDD